MQLIKLMMVFGVGGILCLSGCAGSGGGEDAATTAADDGGTDDGGTVEGGTVEGGTDSSGVDFDAKGHEIILEWAGDEQQFQRLIVTQSGISKTFDGGEDTQATVDPGAWGDSSFNEFVTGAATWRTESSSSADFAEVVLVAEGNMSLGPHFTHAFDDLFIDGVNKDNFPNRAQVGNKLSFSATVANLDLKGKVYVGVPSGAVEEVSIGDGSVLESGQTVSFSYTFSEPGMYVFELSATNGIPQGTWPVYVGASVPLVIGILDRDYPNPPSEPLPEQEMRDKALALVNQVREKAGLNPLSGHTLLDKSADLKCAHMNEHGYFGHSFGGKKRADFLNDAGLSGGEMNEQLVVENNAERAFWFLYWSPLHRVGLLDSRWVSMGSAGRIAAFDEYDRLVFTYHLSTHSP